MKKYLAPLSFVLLFCASGCTTQSQVAQARGAHDLGCAPEEASVLEIPGGAWEVSCNGKKATYVCISTQQSGIICDRDS